MNLALPRRHLAVVLPLFLALATASGQEQVTPATPRAWPHQSSDIEPDPSLHFGSLDNGMRWVWANNAEPRERSYLRLHVDIGSFAERDDERGMAHFLEHMAFNGTRHFAADELIRWFQEHGMQFGADTNAHTGFSETVYNIDLPLSDPATLRSGLQVLRDFADGMILSDQEVDAEKGVIDGEERERDSPGLRMLFGNLRQQFAGTLLAERLPIGDQAVRARFSGESIRAFYEKWYRPENMTLVLVGDLGEFDPSPLITEMFADMKRPAAPWQPEPAVGEGSLEDRCFAVHEAESPYVQVKLQRVKPYQNTPPSAARMRERLALDVAHNMLDLRLAQIAKQADAPFLQASADRVEEDLGVYSGVSLDVICRPGPFAPALAAADLELRRALEFGFQEAELDEVRADLLDYLDESARRDAKRDSRAILAEVLAACEQNHVAADGRTRRAVLRPAAEALTAAECHAALKQAWGSGAQLLSTIGQLDLGDEAATRLSEALAEARKVAPSRADDIGSSTFAYASDPQHTAQPKAREHVEDLDLWLVEFENGVRLNIKRTDFTERQVILSANIGEGRLTLPSDRMALADALDAAFLAGGLAAHTEEDLRRLTAGRQAQLGFDMGDDHASLSSRTTADDQLLALELMCAFIRHPGWRDTGLTQMKRHLPLIHDGMLHSVQGPATLDFLPALWSNDRRMGTLPSIAEIDPVTMDALREWFEPLLDDAPIEITAVGALDVDRIIADVGRTFGTLKPRRSWQEFAEHRQVTPALTGLRMERSVETESPAALVMLTYPTGDGRDAARRRIQYLLALVVDDRVRVEIRERLGASYSPQASVRASQVYPDVGLLTIIANCAPGEVDAVTQACLAIGSSMADDGVTAEEVHRLKEPLLAQLRDQMRNNGAWMNYLSDAQRNPTSLDDTRGLLDFFASISADDLSALAERYLKPERASVLVVKPTPRSQQP